MKQQIIRNEIKQKLKGNIQDKELIVLVFDKTSYNTLKWLKKNEFYYQDHLYDVINIEITEGGSIRIKCIDDKKENQLFKQLDKLTKSSSKNKQNKEILLAKMFVKDYVPTKTVELSNFYKKIIRFTGENKKYKSYIPDKQSPPPKYC